MPILQRGGKRSRRLGHGIRRHADMDGTKAGSIHKVPSISMQRMPESILRRYMHKASRDTSNRESSIMGKRTAAIWDVRKSDKRDNRTALEHSKGDP